MRRKLFLVPLLLCLAAVSPAWTGLADSSTPVPADLFEHLQKQGWTEVSPGVMQRNLGGNRVETLGFGAGGLRFQLQELKAHLVDLRKEHAQHPSRQLRIALRAHRAQILRVEEALKKAAADGLELSTEGLIAQGPGCSANYDATAVAFPLAQGASASARAYFNNACGYTGEVYAHSSSKATAADNTVTTRTQSDPVLGGYTAGANVSASASTSAEGLTACDSYAYASVTTYDLGITYAQSDRNFACIATLPTPWLKTDVGAVGPVGSASHADGVFRLIAGGTDLAGTADAFHFVHQTLAGDGEIIANVAALLKPAGANRTLAGVTFRNDLTAGSAHATMTITSEGEAKFRRRTTASGTTLSDGLGAGTTFAPRWLKLVRSGNIFTAYLSADNVTWTQVHTPQTVPLSTTVHVGLVALRNGTGTPTGAARFEGVAVRSTPAVFQQDFQSSPSVASYVHATVPSTGQFNDISAHADGGTWSIQQGRLQLVREGIAYSAENDAGITRHTNFSGPPSVLHVTFDLGVSGWTASQYQSNALLITIGNISTVTDYSGNIPTTHNFQTVSVNGEGPGRYGFRVADGASAPLDADGTPHRVALFYNKSGAAAPYRAPDGILRSLRSNGVALWVDSAPVVVDAAAMNGGSGSLTDLRFQWRQPENATWTLDNWVIRSYFPQ